MGIVSKFKSQMVKTSFGKVLQEKFGSKKRLQLIPKDLEGLSLNIGCGDLHLDGYINIDYSDDFNPDLVLRAQDLKLHFTKDSIATIQMIHSIGYLSYKEAREFFKDAYELLKFGGQLVIETPSIELIAKTILDQGSELKPETIYPIFAISAEGATHQATYQFIWSSDLLSRTIKDAGFSEISEQKPVSHGQRLDRDIRLTALKFD